MTKATSPPRHAQQTLLAPMNKNNSYHTIHQRDHPTDVLINEELTTPPPQMTTYRFQVIKQWNLYQICHSQRIPAEQTTNQCYHWTLRDGRDALACSGGSLTGCLSPSAATQTHTITRTASHTPPANTGTSSETNILFKQHHLHLVSIELLFIISTSTHSHSLPSPLCPSTLMHSKHPSLEQ